MLFRIKVLKPGKPKPVEDIVLHFGSGNKSLLTAREQEILQLSLKGKSEQQIADMLHIGIGTVKSHKQNIFRKTDAKNIREAGERAGY
jgi:DNA-binding CsgD family transcriptional regulator